MVLFFLTMLAIPAPLANVAAGLVLEHAGRVPAILLGVVALVLVVVVAVVSPAVRTIPRTVDFAPDANVGA